MRNLGLGLVLLAMGCSARVETQTPATDDGAAAPIPAPPPSCEVFSAPDGVCGDGATELRCDRKLETLDQECAVGSCQSAAGSAKDCAIPDQGDGSIWCCYR